MQGRYWSYQFIPSMGLAMYLAGLALPLERRAMQVPLSVLLLALIGLQLVRGPATYYPNPIPRGIRSVAFLSDHVSAAYPHVFECGTVNTSRFPALWTLPGAWNAIHDPTSSPRTRQRGEVLLRREVAAVRFDLLTGKPELIFLERDFATPYFRYPFDYESLMPKGYRKVGSVPGFDVWARADVSPAKLLAPHCGEFTAHAAFGVR
jgi:hypothetical protein